jgi:hypothetical protein
MAQVVSRRPLTAQAQVGARAIHVGFVMDKMARTGFFLSSLVSPVNIILPWLFILTYLLRNEQ